MRARRSLMIGTTTAALIAGAFVVPATVATAESTKEATYLVLFDETGTSAAARQAITSAGGTITETNAKLGYAYVRTSDPAFAAEVNASDAVAGVAKERTIGVAPQERRARADDVERLTTEREAAGQAARQPARTSKQGKPTPGTPVTPEPLANLQWDMRQIGATAAGSYAKDQGAKGVRVGIIDTGVDGSHPDVAPNFDASRSRNFVTDMPDIDGPCEVASCVDPVDVDDDGHGTHVASTIGSPINGLGIAGVAPGVSLVNIRAGQDSGYFFLKATLDALTYAGDAGIDVVNMSFYVDPWLYNCTRNPADSPEERVQQAVIRVAVQRALNYARQRGVLPVAAMGNEATNLDRPTVDTTSPDYPEGAAKPRTVDNSCITVPTESRGVVSVSSTGPSLRKAYYSNYGTEQTDVSAPGGDYYDTPTNTGSVAGLILAAYPEALARESGDIDADGNPTNAFVVKDCKGSVCGYYQYLQGTSMASPHAAGVAALVVSRNGRPDKKGGGLTLDPDRSEALLYSSTVSQECPQPRLFHYTRILPNGNVVEADALCEGPARDNGFYGKGVVNAYKAATS